MGSRRRLAEPGLQGTLPGVEAESASDETVGYQPGEFLPLRGLARALIILLASTVVLVGVTVAIGESHAGQHAAMHARPLVVISGISMTVTSILVLVWLRRARINAERFDWRQRRARAWIFWGWLIPIGNLWIPFQIVGDIWRAGLPPDERRGIAWLPVLWWVSWLLAPPLWIRSTPRRNSQPLVSFWAPLPDGWFSFAFFAMAGLLLIAIIGTVSDGPVGRQAARTPL